MLFRSGGCGPLGQPCWSSRHPARCSPVRTALGVERESDAQEDVDRQTDRESRHAGRQRCVQNTFSVSTEHTRILCLGEKHPDKQFVSTLISHLSVCLEVQVEAHWVHLPLLLPLVGLRRGGCVSPHLAGWGVQGRGSLLGSAAAAASDEA